MTENTTSQDFPLDHAVSGNAFYDQVYGELRRIARRQMEKAWSMGTISTTALVNEAYLKLASLREDQVESRSHFFAIAATAMRQIIINYAEQKRSQKRGGEWIKVTYNEPLHEGDEDIKTLLLVNDALDDIRELDAKLAQLVELRFFAGMTEKEIAEVFQQNERTVRRNWQKAKMLLQKSLQSED